MDQPSFLSAQGLPYEFAQFKLVARGEGDASVEAALNGDVVPLQGGFRELWVHCRLPLYTDLVDFAPARVQGGERGHRGVVRVEPHRVMGK